MKCAACKKRVTGAVKNTLVICKNCYKKGFKIVNVPINGINLNEEIELKTFKKGTK